MSSTRLPMQINFSKKNNEINIFLKEKEKKTTHDFNALILWVGNRVATALVMSVHTCRPGRFGRRDALHNFSFYFLENKLAHSCTYCTFANNTQRTYKKNAPCTSLYVCMYCHICSKVRLNVF